MWTHLEKFRGGIGMRGPGETQLETDRRLIGHRIRVLQERLEGVQRSREVQRAGRQTEFRRPSWATPTPASRAYCAVCLGQEVFVEDRLFATPGPAHYREVSLGNGLTRSSPTPSASCASCPHQLVASFRATLEETREADLPPRDRRESPAVGGAAARGRGRDRRGRGRELPMYYVLNKIDQLEPGLADVFANRFRDEGREVV
jgi:GTP-binding protein HflX